MKIKFWGTRGSIPVPGEQTVLFGGNTPCLEVRSKNNELLIIDGGSGIRNLGQVLAKEDSKEINILFSHYHWDHIQGIPFFIPLYQKDKIINFYGPSSVEDFLSAQMTPDYFPIHLRDVTAKLNFYEIKPNSEFELSGIKIKSLTVNHPSPTYTFNLYENGKFISYMTDNELILPENGKTATLDDIYNFNKDQIEFCRGTEYLIHDTMYDETALQGKKGWGHSGNISLAHFSILANVKNLVLFHYNPDYDDKKISGLVSETSVELKKQDSEIGCIGAREGLEIVI